MYILLNCLFNSSVLNTGKLGMAEQLKLLEAKHDKIKNTNIHLSDGIDS